MQMARRQNTGVEGEYAPEPKRVNSDQNPSLQETLNQEPTEQQNLDQESSEQEASAREQRVESARGGVCGL